MSSAEPTLIRHASAVAVQGRGLMIIGASGTGKSGICLELMARGAQLVSDDGTILTRKEGAIELSAPDPIRGAIEARGIGLLQAETVDVAQLVAVLDMDMAETHRFPPARWVEYLGCRFPLLHNFASPYFPAGLVQYLKQGRRSDL